MKSRSLLLAALVGVATTAWAQYPDKPVTIVVPFSAGGPTDKVARDLGVVLSKGLNNQTVIVENIGGAGGTLGAAKVAKAAPDGYTVLLHHIGMATAPALYRKLPYNVLQDFEYVGMVNEVPMTLVGRATLPANNFAELRTWINANKGKVNLANAGLGAASHLCGLLFQQSLGVEMTTVPYKGTGPAMTDLLAGQTQLMFTSMPSVLPHVKAGKLKILATGGLKRSPVIPNVAAVAETLPGFEVVTWYGILGPLKLPPAIVSKLNAEIVRIVALPDVQKRFSDQGLEPHSSTPEEFQAYMRKEVDKWQKVAQRAGITR